MRRIDPTRWPSSMSACAMAILINVASGAAKHVSLLKLSVSCAVSPAKAATLNILVGSVLETNMYVFVTCGDPLSLQMGLILVVILLFVVQKPAFKDVC